MNNLKIHSLPSPFVTFALAGFAGIEQPQLVPDHQLKDENVIRRR
jgi:hypothetical protein